MNENSGNEKKKGGSKKYEDMPIDELEKELNDITVLKKDVDSKYRLINSVLSLKKQHEEELAKTKQEVEELKAQLKAKSSQPQPSMQQRI